MRRYVTVGLHNAHVPSKEHVPMGDLDPHLVYNGSLAHTSQPRNRHLDRFSRFYTAQPCAQHTDTQTTLRATYIATGRIYALRADDAA